MHEYVIVLQFILLKMLVEDFILYICNVSNLLIFFFKLINFQNLE